MNERQRVNLMTFTPPRPYSGACVTGVAAVSERQRVNQRDFTPPRPYSGACVTGVAA